MNIMYQPEEIEKIGQSTLKKFAEDIVRFSTETEKNLNPEVIKWLLYRPQPRWHNLSLAVKRSSRSKKCRS